MIKDVMKGNTYLFETVDPCNRTIHLKETTWEHKITNKFGTNNDESHGHSHPEMDSLLNEVMIGTTTPLYIVENNSYVSSPHSREQFISTFVKPNGRLSFISTIVEFNELNVGDIVTTHIMSKPIIRGDIIYDARK